MKSPVAAIRTSRSLSTDEQRRTIAWGAAWTVVNIAVIVFLLVVAGGAG